LSFANSAITVAHEVRANQRRGKATINKQLTSRLREDFDTFKYQFNRSF